MIDERFIYGQTDSIFKQVLAAIGFGGTYHVSPNYGSDLNTNNLKRYIKDPLYGLSTIHPKYPICVCITPRSKPFMINSTLWEKFYFSLFFLRRTFLTPDNKVDSPDLEVQKSTLNIEDDWAEMKNISFIFLTALFTKLTTEKTIILNPLKPAFFATVLTLDQINGFDLRRISRANNDDLTGVQLDFILNLNMINC